MDVTRSTVGTGSNPFGVVRSFSTRAAPREQRIPLWEEHNRRALVDLRAACFATGSLSSTMLSLSLPSVDLTDIASNDHVIERSAAHIKRTPSGTLLLCLLAKGSATFYSPHGTVRIGSANAILYDPDEPFMYGFDSSMRQHTFQVSREKFEDLTGSRALNSPMVFGRTDASLISALRDLFVDAMYSAIVREGRSGYQFGETFDELFTMLMGSRNRGRARAHYAMARDYIVANFDQPELSVRNVAATVGLSERQLSRVFADRGFGVAQLITETRLEAARDLLTSARGNSFSIGEIARRVGYCHLSHFSRSFKARYGITAREMRILHSN